jgi:hypothetical protein
MDDRQRTPSDGKSSHCLWQGELKSGSKLNTAFLLWSLIILCKNFKWFA